jgi:hypothetical protein
MKMAEFPHSRDQIRKLNLVNDWATGVWQSFIHEFRYSIVRHISFSAKSNYAETILAFVLPFTIYILTLAPTIYNLDSAELTTAAATGGLTRATGYPFYLAIGHLWSKVPIGDMGYRMNLLSAIFGALTIALADRILYRWNIGKWARIGSLGLLATGIYFWGMSLVAEVYTLHTAIVSALILATFNWSDNPSPRKMVIIGLLVGLGLSHHAAIVLIIPGIIFYLVTKSAKNLFNWKTLLVGGLGLAIGLSFYLYLPIRYSFLPPFNYAGTYGSNLIFNPQNLHTPAGIYWLISGKSFSGQMLAYNGKELLIETWQFLIQLARTFWGIGIIAGIIGIIALFRRSWQEAGAFLLFFLISTGFYIDYRVIDKNTMFLPSFLIWSLWAALGYQSLLDWLRKVDREQTRGRGLLFMRVLLISIVSLALVWNWSLVDLSNDWSTRERGEEILELVQPNGIVFGWWDTVPVLQYLQLVENNRPDVTAINRFLISPDDMYYAIQEEVNDKPIYIDNPPNYLLNGLQTKSVGPIYQLIYTSEGGD